MARNNIIIKTREISNFDRVELRDYGELIVTQDGRESLIIEAERGLFPKIKAEVQDGTLVLAVEQSQLERLLTSALTFGKKHVKYHLTVEAIRGLRVSGACTVISSNIETDHLELRSSGASKVELRALAAEKLDVDISGGTVLGATGKVEEQVISISGSGDYSAPELESREASVRISGQGTAIVRVHQTLDVTVSGPGRVEYYGNPAVYQSASDAGSVSQLDDVTCLLQDRELSCG